MPEPTIECSCGEVIELDFAKDTMFADIECPRCGTDVSLEDLWDEVLGDDPMGDYYGRNY